MKLKYVFFALYSVAIAFLLSSVIHSGYSYIFDPDELFHINASFLLTHGLVPYRDFFMTYTPIFHWFLVPLSFFTDFSFRFLEASRIAMIVLFVFRIALTFMIARKLFGSLVAYLSLPLSLFDPFTAFTGMQVRPDNLMMTIYLASLYLVMRWYADKKPSVLLWAGLLLGISAVTLLKNIPATFIIMLCVLTELWNARNSRGIAEFLFVMILPAALFAAWLWYQGVFPLALQQILFDGKLLNDTLRYPQNILNYYWPPNFVLYGAPGRPLTWMYTLWLPFLAFAGIFTAFTNLKSFGANRKPLGWFTAACFLQWISLLFVRSVFLQYFLSVSWFFAVFAAYALMRVYQTLQVNSFNRRLVSAAAVLLLIGGFIISWRANAIRAKSSFAVQKSYLTALWRVIPQNASVFPGAVFRTSLYPLGYETNFVDMPSEILDRYGSPSSYLVRYRIPYVLIDSYNFSFLDTQTQQYIKTHYQQSIRDPNLWTRES